MPSSGRAARPDACPELRPGRSSRRSRRLKNGRILRIILYGSYARGDWVEDPVGRYFSDYDLLVVVADEKHADVLEFWETAEKRLLAALLSGDLLRIPVSFIVRSLVEVNGQLERGRYFFLDIGRDGVALFEGAGAAVRRAAAARAGGCAGRSREAL